MMITVYGTPADRRRFMSYVRRTSTCWIWIGAHDHAGYGMFWISGATRRASRTAYLLFTGQIPDGLLIRHTCDNPPCVNPAHLITGTVRDNALDAQERGRLATGERNGSRLYPERLKRGRIPGPCRNGHAESCRYIGANGEARCRECQRLRAARYRAKAVAR